MNEYEHLKDLLKASKHTVVLTGAGMSTESGVPDFRSQSGWWQQIDPRTVATTEALAHNYALFHQFYVARMEALQQAAPHEGHYILADWQKRGLVTHVATQNVDSFHTLAGSVNVDELHGSIRTVRCNLCRKQVNREEFVKGERCACGGKLRPDVVLFGETLPQNAWNNTLSHMEAAELVIVIGTSLEVYPVNQLPLMTRGKTVYINLAIGKADFDLMIAGKAGEVLREVNNLLNKEL